MYALQILAAVEKVRTPEKILRSELSQFKKMRPQKKRCVHVRRIMRNREPWFIHINNCIYQSLCDFTHFGDIQLDSIFCF